MNRIVEQERREVLETVRVLAETLCGLYAASELPPRKPIAPAPGPLVLVKRVGAA